MALQSCPRIFWPEPSYSQAVGGNRDTLDAAGEYTAMAMVAPEAMTISHVGFLPGTVTGSGAADLRIETLDASTGLPSGTLWAANTNVTTGALTSNTWFLGALTASASISAGQVFCLKIGYNAGTSFITRAIQAFEPNSSLPYRISNTGTPTISAGTEYIIAVLGSSSSTFYNMYGIIPWNGTSTNNTFNNTSSAKRGLRFQVPFKCRCVGIWAHGHTAIGDLNALIENDAGSEQSSSSTAFDGDLSAASGGSGIKTYYFDNPVTLSPATWYRAVLEPSSATNISIYTMTLPSSDYRSGTAWGSNAHYATYTSGGGWVDTATDQLPIMGIIIDQLSDDAGSGGTGGYVIGG